MTIDYLTGIGEDISCCYYIKSGICRCSILNDNGEELILSWHGPGSLFFIYLRGFPPSGQCIDLSQEEVASILGVSRVQVARVYQRLRKEGIIFSSRKRIQVIHPEGMKIYFEFLNQ